MQEIAASITPRKIALAGTMDAEGSAMKTDAVRAKYDAASQAGNVSVVPTADWSAKALLAYVSSALST